METNTENINNIFEIEAYIWDKIMNDWSFSFIIKKAALDKQLQITPTILENFTAKMLQNFLENNEMETLVYFLRKFDALNNIDIKIILPEGCPSLISDVFKIPNRSLRTDVITDSNNSDHYYLYWILGGITLLAIVGTCYYLYKKHKDRKGPYNGGEGGYYVDVKKKQMKESIKNFSSSFFKYFIIKRMSIVFTLIMIIYVLMCIWNLFLKLI